jgi:hypothetical protein
MSFCEDIHNCYICLEHTLNNENIILKCCGRVIHTQCIEEWLKFSDNCIFCKQQIYKTQIYGIKYKKYEDYVENKKRSIKNFLFSFSSNESKQNITYEVTNDDELDDIDKIKLVKFIINY